MRFKVGDIVFSLSASFNHNRWFRVEKIWTGDDEKQWMNIVDIIKDTFELSRVEPFNFYTVSERDTKTRMQACISQLSVLANRI